MTKTINHEITKASIQKALGYLKEQANAAAQLKKNKAVIFNDSMLSEEYKTKKIEALDTAYYSALEENKGNIIAELDKVLANELENEGIVDLNVPGYLNIIVTIYTTNGKLPAEVIEGIKNSLKWNYNALKCAVAAFEDCAVDISKYNFEECTVSAALVIPKLQHSAQNIELAVPSAFVDIQNLYLKIVRFAEARGIVLDDNEKRLLIDEEIKEDAARAVMGL